MAKRQIWSSRTVFLLAAIGSAVGLLWELSIWFITPVALAITIFLSLKTELSAAYEGYSSTALAIGGWGIWSTTIMLALLLQKDKLKWIKMMGFLPSF